MEKSKNIKKKKKHSLIHQILKYRLMIMFFSSCVSKNIFEHALDKTSIITPRLNIEPFGIYLNDHINFQLS